MASMKWKALGAIVTVAGGLLTLAANHIEEKRQDQAIEEKVNEILAKREEES